jgi:RHS repeat-associated protein
VYNGDGLRTTKTVNGTTTTSETWDVAEGMPLLIGEGGLSYVTGPGGLPLEQISASGTVLYYHEDQLGSVRVLTDQSGAVQASYSYDSYGNATSATGTTVNPYRYAGQVQDAESGLYYLRARYYDPATAQFISSDPIVSLTRQPYVYAENSPQDEADPSGRMGEGPAVLCAEDPECRKTPAKPVSRQELADAADKIALVCGVASLFIVIDEISAPCAVVAGIASYLLEPPKADLTDAALICGITGFTGHGFDQRFGRDGHGVRLVAVYDAVQNPMRTKWQPATQTMLYYGKDARVALNKAGKVVSTWATNRKGWWF